MINPSEPVGKVARAWHRGWLPALLLVVGVLLAYQPVWHAGFIWDDDAYVTDNPLLTAPDGLRRIWFSLDSPSQYFPLVYSSFRLEHAFWGLNPTGYHWVNLLLHSANALLLWRLLKRLNLPGAWLAAALFALHPVNVESVAWITERKNVLCLFFSLLTVRSWLGFVTQRFWRWYGLALALYPWALFSKTTACTLPAALLLLLWLQGERITTRRIAQVAPFVLMGLGMGLVTMWWERFHNGTQGAQFSVSWPQRFLVAGHALWFYLGKLLWPVKLVFSYPHWNLRPAAWGWWLACALLGGLIYYARRWTGRGVEVAAVFYVATLSPLLGFIMLYTFRYTYVADHYQYVAMIGPLALAAAGLTLACRRYAQTRPWLLPMTSAVLLLVLGSLTWRQSSHYRDIQTLWRATLETNPESTLAINNLGTIFLDEGRLDDAIVQFRKTLTLQPDFAEAEDDLASALLKQNHPDEALTHYRRAVELHPRTAAFHENLASALLQLNQPDGAIAEYRQAVTLLPRSARARCELGKALYATGRADEGIACFRQAVELQPDYADARYNLGTALDRQGHADEAIAQFQAVLALEPGHTLAHNNLGSALLRQGRVDDAIVQFQAVADLQPGFAPARNNLGAAWLQKGDQAEAIRQFQRALEIQPDYVAVQNTLGRLAWDLATSPDAAKRNGARAIELARQVDAAARHTRPLLTSTLAAAYAEAGQFPDAIATAQSALQLAAAQTNTALVNAVQLQLKSYEAGQPFRQP